MKKIIRWFIIFVIILFVLQLLSSILYCVMGYSICAAINGFASGISFMGSIVMYDMYKDYKE